MPFFKVKHEAGAMTYHEHDFYTWAKENATLLRAKRFEELDIDNIAEELEDMGSSRERELESRLGILLAHLLKWYYQPERHSVSWTATIMEQRRRIERLLRKNPGLKAYLEEAFWEAYGDARLIAMRETGLQQDIFPESPSFTLTQVLDVCYWPE
jgi:iron-sulfur cluster repair protein YtfE (RIC family)